VPALAAIKQQKRSIVSQYAKPNNLRGAWQVLTTLLPVAALWYVASRGDLLGDEWMGITAVTTLLMSLFLLRVFVLMHDCGHGSLFRNSKLNQVLGFGLGVLSGMPQFVWAQHHNYHHSTNGNWAKYRGPLAILSVGEYDLLSRWQQWTYVCGRSICLAPFGGFLYLIFNPRFTWMKGTAALVRHVVRGKIRQPDISLRAHAAGFETRYWASSRQYWHMTMNNLVLLSAWALMSWLIGPAQFFFVYLVSASLAGGAGIVLFAVQHNFEHSYASGDQGWDYDAAAIYGSSFLALPGWLNWFTASIGYHHVHHLSAQIPNYRLSQCHAENRSLFVEVKQLKLGDIHASLKFLLWDPQSRRIISVAEYEAAGVLAPAV